MPLDVLPQISTSDFTQAGVDLSELIDGYFYGSIIAFVLLGINIVQAWIYYNTNTDKLPLKLLVGALILVDFATTCLHAQILHHYLVEQYGNIIILSFIPVSLVVEYFLMLITVLAVEYFFAFRVWQLQKFHWAVPALILLCSTGGAGCGIASAIGQAQDNQIASLDLRKQKFEVGWNYSLSALSDIITTIALSWSFFSSKTGIRRTDTLLKKLLQYTVTRGLFVSLMQTALVITFLVNPVKLWWTPFHLSMGKIYVLTMVAMLNTRKNLHTKATVGIITDSEMGIQSEPTTGDATAEYEQHEMVFPKKQKSIQKVVLAPFKRGGNLEDGNIDMGKKFSSHNGICITQERLPPQVI
ncbi:hypothetical protein K435DRAFT_874328 [Dendrothele bispora CBS 962.96]|uniref:DUF6534 domain-containing protein n=1 Tax=Dendrothele bispora (strain CBS 962.96) TaxID=1314807 RepID=A0A4S8KWZ8_DENBC|nr:hypothetical protein K435DRAFT_874328 [Dendrothele bispora CBS 962.96]